MRNLNEHNITQAVVARHDRAPDVRLREVMTVLVRHLHEFARETRLTEAEWFEGIKFLTATGHITDERRQEFILLSDVLGLSNSVEASARREGSYTKKYAAAPSASSTSDVIVSVDFTKLRAIESPGDGMMTRECRQIG